MDIEILSDEWLAAQIYENRDAELNHWSIDYVIDMKFDKRFPELWQFIKATYVKDCPEYVLDNLASGALEDFLVGAGEQYFDEIEKLSNSDSRFKKLLRGVWQNEMPREFWLRICELRELS
ncbi:MAG: hypothetical protein MK188_12140 [Gammaproteobacteria bacterium]|nr:hypothetical protein [Gammaproteobacteria bacterium]